jgi:hypothetical protein
MKLVRFSANGGASRLRTVEGGKQQIGQPGGAGRRTLRPFDFTVSDDRFLGLVVEEVEPLRDVGQVDLLVEPRAHRFVQVKVLHIVPVTIQGLIARRDNADFPVQGRGGPESDLSRPDLSFYLSPRQRLARANKKRP